MKEAFTAEFYWKVFNGQRWELVILPCIGLTISRHQIA